MNAHRELSVYMCGSVLLSVCTSSSRSCQIRPRINYSSSEWKKRGNERTQPSTYKTEQTNALCVCYIFVGHSVSLFFFAMVLVNIQRKWLVNCNMRTPYTHSPTTPIPNIFEAALREKTAYRKHTEKNHTILFYIRSPLSAFINDHNFCSVCLPSLV